MLIVECIHLKYIQFTLVFDLMCRFFPNICANGIVIAETIE